MPRVLRILNRLIIGGPSLNASYLTRYMAPEFETMLLIGDKDNHEKDAIHLTERLGIKPVIISEMKRSIRPIDDRAAYLKIKSIIKDFKPDVVHTHAAKSGTIGRLAAYACDVPVIVHTFHGHVFHSYFNKLETNTYINIERYLARRSSGIIAISDLQKKELADVYRICPADKINIIPLGLDLNKFSDHKAEKRKDFRKKYFIEDDEIVIGIIGRVVPVKNHNLFVKIAAEVIGKTKEKLRFLIIGDGSSRGEMEAEFKNANIDYAYYPEDPRKATAICTSWQIDMDHVLAGMDIVALTSNNEGTPVSLIEAQAAAKPIVSTRVGGVADTILDGRSGFITEPGNVQAFGAALLQLINNHDLRETFGRSGENYAKEKFSYHRLVNDTAGYYKKLLAEAKRK